MTTNIHQLAEPMVQSLGCAWEPDSEREAHWPTHLTGHNPLAVVALLTLRQRDDGHVQLTLSVCDHYKETQFPLANLVDDELDRASLVLASPGERANLTLAAARSRFYAESKLARVLRGERVADVTRLLPLDAAGSHEEREATLAALLNAPWAPPTVPVTPDSASCKSAQHRARLTDQAIVRATGRLIAWCQVEAALTAEPGLFFEVMLAVSAWLDEHWTDHPVLGSAARSRPLMWAKSFQSLFREDLAARTGGTEPLWPALADGTFTY